MAAAADRGPLGALQEFLFRPGEQLRQRGLVQVVARPEVRFVRGLRELVPRAHQLAVVAAADAVADQRPQLFVDAAFVLDGEEGDAASRVEPARCVDCAGWTYVDAASAGAEIGRASGRERVCRYVESSVV